MRSRRLRDNVLPGTELDLKAAIASTSHRSPRKRDEIAIARTPYAWDLPVWLASGELDAIQLIHHHALRDGVVDNEDDGRPRDKIAVSRPHAATAAGRKRFTTTCSIAACASRRRPAAARARTTIRSARIACMFIAATSSPTSAGGKGSKRAECSSPTARCCGRWSKASRPAMCFISTAGGSLTLEIGLNLATRVPVEYLQIIKNGASRPKCAWPIGRSRRAGCRRSRFDDSGWFLVRAVTNNQQTYQFASSGPYYVEKAGQPRVSRRSVQFFLDWIDAAEARFASCRSSTTPSAQTLLAEQESARQFFEELLATANAD